MRVGTWNVENLFTPAAGTGYGPSEQAVFKGLITIEGVDGGLGEVARR